MYFKVSSAAPFLLKGWSLQRVDGLLAAVIATIALSVIRECLAYSLHTEEQLIGIQRKIIMKTVLIQTRRAGVHMINTAFAYTLMLCVMTYNVWLLVLVSMSAGLSYLFFRPMIERACRNSQKPSDQQTHIALISSKHYSQEDSLHSHTKFTGRAEGRSSHHATGGAGNHEFRILNPLLMDDKKHIEIIDDGTSSKERSETLPSKTQATFKEYNRVAGATNKNTHCCK